MTTTLNHMAEATAVWQQHRKRVAFIAGPMRDIDQFNFPAFDIAEEDLTLRGFVVKSPARHDREEGFDPTQNSLQGFDLKAAFRWNIESILKSDLVVALGGWEGSRGVAIELNVARAIGLPVVHYPGLEAIPDPAAPKSALMEAEGLVHGDRDDVYGHPFEDFSRTAMIWEAIFGVEVTPEQVALAMVGVKMSRLCNTPSHHDSVVDIAGYAETLHMIQEWRADDAV